MASDPQGPGGFDLGGLMKMAQQMQEQMQEAQEVAADTELVGSAGGGAVEITASGDYEFIGVKIDPKLVDPADVAMLEDTILAALGDLAEKIAELQGNQMGGLDMGGGMGGLDLGGLSGLLGGGPD